MTTTRFREELHHGLDRKTAILRAANNAEQSIFQSAVVFFMATFGVYLVCNINMIKGMCALLARGAIISALSIIFFLTPLLYIFEGVIDKTTLGWHKGKNLADAEFADVTPEAETENAQEDENNA